MGTPVCGSSLSVSDGRGPETFRDRGDWVFPGELRFPLAEGPLIFKKIFSLLPAVVTHPIANTGKPCCTSLITIPEL